MNLLTRCRPRLPTVLAALLLAGCTAPVTTPPTPAPTDRLAIELSLPRDAWVTVVIEDDQGRRIRNRVAEQFYPAGRTVIDWDGRCENGALVAPGRYRWRGLYRDAVRVNYEFSVYDAGASLPWFHPSANTATNSGWLSDHNPAWSVCAAGDRIFVGAITSENGQDLMALDLDGRKHWGASHPYGCGASDMVFDGTHVYGAGEAQWAGDNAHVYRIDPRTFQHELIWSHKGRLGLRGAAVRDGKLYLASDRQSKILILDLATKQLAGDIPLSQPGGLGFTPDGRLLAGSGRSIVLVGADGRHTPLITDHLTRPNRLAVGADGTIYVSDGPTSWYRANDDEHNALYGTEDVRFTGDNQIKVFDAAGQFQRAIGKPGGRRPGPYDPQAMRCPVGLALDVSNRLWVAEWDMLPKRISVWDPATGQLLKEFLGSHKYGGGGALDPGDRTQMILDGMLFKLDWPTGRWRLTDTIVDIMSVATEQTHALGGYEDWPDRIVRVNGQPYYVAGASSWNKGGTIWRRVGENFRAVACVRPYNPGLLPDGEPNTNHWLYARMVEVMGPRPPGGAATDIGGPVGKWNGFISYLMLWSDSNGDGVTQPDEVTFTDKPHYWLQAPAIGPDLAIYLRMPAHRGVTSVWRLPPRGFNAHGAPLYDANDIEPLLLNAVDTATLSDVVVDEANRVFILGEPIYGVDRARQQVWSYPNPWPGLGNGAPRPQPGVVVGGWGLRGAAGGFMALNSNYGQWYLFTADGLFFSTIFGDTRTAPFWGAHFAEAKRGMDATTVSHGQESFFGWFGQTSDRQFYCVAGHPHFSILHVTGLDRMHRINGQLTVTAAQLAALPPLTVPPPTATVYTQSRTQGARGATQVRLATRPQPGFYPDYPYASWLSYDADALYLEAKLPELTTDDALSATLDLPGGTVHVTLTRSAARTTRELPEASVSCEWQDDIQGGGWYLRGRIPWTALGTAPFQPGAEIKGDICFFRAGHYRLCWADKNALPTASGVPPIGRGTLRVE